ncbi:MAG: sulfur transferase domain-containing protein [Woeseiaceae bacterium]
MLKQEYLQVKALELAPDVYVCGQLFETDLQLIAGQGVRSIVNNRFDHESTGQPLSANLERAAQDLGMAFLHFPVDLKSITDQDVESFARACEGLERPLLIFSRSGRRSIKIWEKAEGL